MTLDIISLLNVSDSIADSAIKITQVIIKHLKNDDTNRITISFVGIKGLPPTFYNTLLLILKESFGDDAINMLDFIFDSSQQKDVFNRSANAIFGKII